MTIKDIFSAKTAAELVGITSKEAADEPSDSAFANTDPRFWTTPLGMLAGLAITHALSKPGKRYKAEYLAGGGLGALAGKAVGKGLITHHPFYAGYRNAPKV